MRSLREMCRQANFNAIGTRTAKCHPVRGGNIDKYTYIHKQPCGCEDCLTVDKHRKRRIAMILQRQREEEEEARGR